jgi:hypothetical protein
MCKLELTYSEGGGDLMRHILLLTVLVCAGVSLAEEQEFVGVRAILVEYLQESPWSEYSLEMVEDGVAPLATFEIILPEEFNGLRVGILFKYQNENDSDSLMNLVGREFTFALPTEFLDGEWSTLDNLEVIGLEGAE